MDNALATLNLPHAVQAQALKLLERIHQAHSADELWRASDRAAGFVLGLETVEALGATSIEGLYVAFDNAATARRLEQEQRSAQAFRKKCCAPGRAARGARVPGGQNRWRTRLGAVDPPRRQRRALGAGTLAAREGAHLGQSDRRRPLCR